MRESTVVSGFASRKAEALFVFLACQPRPHPRETLATLLWPDNDQGRALANLSVALTSLRKQLGAFLITDRHTLAFNAGADFELDSAEFQYAITQGRDQQQRSGKLGRTGAAQLTRAVSLYRGDFLAGFNIRNAPDFEAWALLEQERLRQQMINALTDLINFHEQRGQNEDGIRCAQQLLSLDTMQEEAHRQLMRLFVSNNQRAAALAQYEQCVRILDEELGVEPDEETTALYEQIATGANAESVTSERRVLSLPIATSPAHNLATATTRFIGRKSELAQIDTWLAQPDGRLLTITGPGGMGKTRLAQETARAYLGEFADGVWIISLVPLQDVNDVATAIAEAMGLSLSGKDDVATQVRKQLQPLETLLILDNLEHLLTSELRDFISQLTQAAPELRLIVTSRERLHLQAETLLELDGLPFPQVSPSSVRDLRVDSADFPAIELFTNRVERIHATANLDAQAGAVTQLCQLIGGLPLALELAATWTRILSVTEIVAEIERSLDALTTTLHDVSQRHRSLRAVIDTSWEMLDTTEQTLFRKLAVFRGGFTRSAAQAIAAATLSQLMSLVDRSFLRLDNDQRFRRHPLLLQFAQEQLAGYPDELTATQAAHARFFADFVQTQETTLKQTESAETLAALAADWENMRAAWQYGLDTGDLALLDQMVTGIGRFFASRGRPLEAALLFEDGYETLLKLPKTSESEQIITKIEVELGYFRDQTGRLTEAEAILLLAEERTRLHEMTLTRIKCLRILGVVVDNQGKRELSRRYLEEAHQLCQTTGENDQLLPILNALGNLCVSNAEFEQARSYFVEAMTIAEALGNTLRMAVLHNNIAIIANRQKHYDEAIQEWRLAQRGFHEHKHELGEANTIFNMSMALHGLGRYDEALESIQHAYTMLEKLGQRHGMAAGLGVKGMIYHKMGKPSAARRYLRDCVLLSHEIGSAGTAMHGLAEVAEVEISAGNLEQAVFLLTFITQHPATGGTTRANAEKLLAELTAELPPEMIADAQAAAANHTLDSIIVHLYGSL